MANTLTKTQAQEMRWIKKEIESAEKSNNWIEFTANSLLNINVYHEDFNFCMKEAEEIYRSNIARGFSTKEGMEKEFNELKHEHIIRALGCHSTTLKALEKKGFIHIFHLQSEGWDEEYHSMDVFKVLHF